MRVYVAHSGDYSGRGVSGVFTNKEKAEESSTDVEEWELDEVATWTKHDVFEVRIKIADGSAVWTSKRQEFQPSTYHHSDIIRRLGDPLAVGVSSVGVAHALKLAAEARQAWLRENPPQFGGPGLDRVAAAGKQ